MVVLRDRIHVVERTFIRRQREDHIGVDRRIHQESALALAVTVVSTLHDEVYLFDTPLSDIEQE